MSSIFFGLAAAIICFSVLIFGIKKASELEYMTDEERQNTIKICGLQFCLAGFSQYWHL